MKGLDIADGPPSSATAESESPGAPTEGSSSQLSGPEEQDKNSQAPGV